MTESDDGAGAAPGAAPAPVQPARQRARGGRSAPATIYDIAALAGVNPSTVSRALSKPGRISAKTEKAIQDAAKQLNYRANPMARALPTGRSRTLGLIIADITNPMYFDVLRGAERAAALSGYTLVIAESQESGEREATTAERIAPSVDGLILGTTRLTDAEIAALAETKPLVVINRRVDDAPDVEAIVPQLEPGIRQALTHLAAHGHTSVVYLSGPDRSWMSTARGEALAAEAREPGVDVVQIGPGAPTLQGGRDALDAVLASGASAVIAYNDLMAIGLLHAAQERGLRIPGRLSIVGFDDIFGSDFTSPPLTTVRTPLGLMGELAARKILDHLGEDPPDAGLAEPDRPAETTLLATELVVRGSTGPIEN